MLKSEIRLIGRRKVAIEVALQEKKTSFGIILPDVSETMSNIGEIVAKTSDVADIRVGDRVVYTCLDGDFFKTDDDHEICLISTDSVVGVVEEEDKL